MSKGSRTRALILEEALALGSQVGLEGLSIGSLASRLGLSKSGLFSHFGSKEDLQLLTLEQVQRLFQQEVLASALAESPGLPRLRRLFSNWLAWLERDRPGGCLMLAASSEYDDRPGPVRDALVAGQRELRGAIAKAIRQAIDAGHLAPHTDPWQLGFEIVGIILATHHDRRLLGDARSRSRAGEAFERLIGAFRPAP